MKAERRKEKSLFHANGQIALAFAALVLLVTVVVLVFLRFYNAYNDEVLYAERLNQMQEVTEQLFAGLEDVVDVQWSNAKYQCNYLEAHSLVTVEDLLQVMQDQTTLGELEKKRTELIAIDSDGHYYSPDGQKGLMVDMSYLNGRPEQVSYVFNEMTTTRTQMLFLYRLDEPITLQSSGGSRQIIYYGIAEDMEQLDPYFSCEAYDGNNSTYVVDAQGIRLFSGRKSGKDLLDGFNVFTVLRRMNYLHDLSFDDTLNTLRKNGIAYSNAILDGEEYYYALYQMENAEWVLVFLVPSSYVATNTVELVDTTTKLLLAFAVLMTLLCAVLIYTVLCIQQRRALRMAAETNAVLEANNNKLEQAQAATTEALQMAEAASKAKTDFLSNMSHDIRTPMNAIIGLTTLMKSEPGLSDKMRDYLTKLETSGHHLLELINNVLDMNRIESGKSTLNVTSVNLAEQITQVETIIGSQAGQQDQTFTILTTHLNHENIITDPARLQQILVNILSNAVKYTPKGGHILFEIEELPRDEHYAKYKFIVQDDGIGMSEEYLQHIFDPFSRMESSVTNQVQGTGLGMAITKSVVDLMGGVIHVESTLGKGSRFEVTLEFPIDTEADQSVQHLSLLLVQCSREEDFQRIQDAVMGRPVRLHRTRTLEEGINALHQASYDVVLMPMCTTEENVRKIRELAGPAAILLGTADGQSASIVAAKELDGILAYPFFLSNLETEVERVREVHKISNGQQCDSPLRGMKFLCAEDNEINAEILRMLLEIKGASCKIYRNGQELVDAFALVRPGDYDMILMDVQMPVMDGLEATRRIRSGENPLGKTIPIVAMTANAFLEDRQQSRDAGMDEHLSKPVDIAALEQVVRKYRVTPPPKINSGEPRFARQTP